VAPIVGGIAAGVWLLVFGLTRYASVASVISALSLPLWAWLIGYPWPVMAFAGVEETRRLYRVAVEERYRFYSFGDAMIVL